MDRSGFTVVEIIITVTIMGILLTLAVVNLNSTQVRARDDERKTDISSIQTYLESYSSSGSSNPSIGTIKNIVTDPKGVNPSSALFITAFGGVTRTTGVSWNGVSNWYRYTWTNTANHNLSRHLLNLSELTNGQEYTISFLAGNSGSSEISATSDFSDVNIASFSLQPGEIKRISYTSSRPTYDSTYRFVDFNVGTGAAGMLITDLMVVEGDTLYSFSHGGSPGWAWSGSPNGSTSSGPMISTIPGSYPAVALISEELLSLSFQGVDVKSFIAPNSTAVSESFIPAINSDQSTNGVSPQPSTNQYIYQPIDSNGNLCHDYDCRKYNLFYRLEGDNTVYKATSRNQ